MPGLDDQRQPIDQRRVERAVAERDLVEVEPAAQPRGAVLGSQSSVPFVGWEAEDVVQAGEAPLRLLKRLAERDERLDGDGEGYGERLDGK